MKIKLMFLVIVGFIQFGFAQITWTPSFATDSDSITVTFDASKGSGGLAGYTGDVYAHVGVITNLSSSGSDWRYVIGSGWGDNLTEPKLSRIGQDLYQLKISTSVREYFKVPSSEKILQIALVFRSGTQVNGSYLEGKTETGGDIFLPIYESGLNVQIIEPKESPVFPKLNDTLAVSAASSKSQNLALYLDGNLLAQTADTILSYKIITSSIGKKLLTAVATGYNNKTKVDSFYFIVNPPVTIEALPEGIEDGINYVGDNSIVLSLFAPHKDFIYVIGDFNNWEADPDYMMKLTPDSTRFWLQINGLQSQHKHLFQYLVDGTLRIADPYSTVISDPWNDKWISSTTYPNLIPYPTGKTSEIATIIEPGKQPFQWKVNSFARPKKTDLVIYELLIRDFIAAHDYQALKDTLGYLKHLGINAIELMPVMEFEGNESWGYNVDFHMALDKYYGTKEAFKDFIDYAHQNGIAVILDIVLNHAFGQSPLVRLYWDSENNRPAANSPWFNQIAKHPFNVGYDFNHESPATQYYVDRVNAYWLKEFHVDGFRFDLSKGFTQKYSGTDVNLWGQYDQSRINILERMADKLWQADSSAYVILEHFADNSEEKVLSDDGMLLWGNLNYSYNEASMGYKSDLSGISYEARGWNDPHLVGYMESHDEERLMYKDLQYGNASGDYNIKNLNTALDRQKLAAAFFFTVPGPKMIWQFGELGYDISIEFNGRLGNKPIKWDYYNDPYRNKLYKVYSALIHLKRDYPVFESKNYTFSADGFTKRLVILDSTMDVDVLGNFDVVEQNITPNFPHTGYWYDYFSGDSINVYDPVHQLTYKPGEVHIYTSKRIPAPEPGIISDVSEVFNNNVSVSNFNLMQNYPNPFNPSTQISYQIAAPAYVVLKIYDMLGREVKTLVNTEKENGIYNVNWNGENNSGINVSSGMYIYQLKAGNFISTKKMILLK